MRIVLSSLGSRGDVHPVIEIAAGLRAKGHDVSLCVPAHFEAHARRRGLAPVEHEEDAEATMHKLGAGWDGARRALSWFRGSLEASFDVLLDEARRADALVTSANEPGAPSIAEHLGIPHFRVAYAPVLPGSQPPPLIPWQGLPPLANRVLWRGLNGAVGLFVRRRLDERRKSLGLGRVGDIAEYFAAGSRTLLAINEHLAPPAADWRHPHTYTGYCFATGRADLPDDLRLFLDAGPPPVYIGFGSVMVPRPERLTAKFVAATKRAGCRAVLAAGWTGLGRADLPGKVFLAGETPHEALFPRLAGIAHHGGSGTVHTAARAGIPQFVMPQIADQFYWGHRLHALGLGPAPVSPGRLSIARIADALRTLTHDAAGTERARAMAAHLATEDGVAAAVEAITSG